MIPDDTIPDIIELLERGEKNYKEDRLEIALKKYKEHFGEDPNTEDRYDGGDELAELLERCIRRNRKLSGYDRL